MKYSREYLERLSGETGFRPDTLEKVLRLERLLDQVTRHAYLGPRLVLKGGTAFNLFYAPAPRLSVDLDFNYVGAVEREVMLREQPEVQRAVEQISSADGYRVQRGREEHAGRKLYLNYVNGLGTGDHIEVDVNYMFRVPLVSFGLRQGWTPDADFSCRARVVGFEEVMAGKLVAFLDRVAARDLYDVASFAAGPPKHEEAALRRLFVGLSGVLPRALSSYSPRHLDSFTQKVLDAELAPMVRTQERPELEALRSRVEPVLTDLLGLSSAEGEYVDRLQRGEFLPELVAKDDPELLTRLRSHPALRWKVENARKRRS